jgi:hypothetical protein
VVQLVKLSNAELIGMCQFLRDIHAEAYGTVGYGQLSGKFVNQFINEAHRLNMGVREVVKAFVHLLEVAEQHRNVDVVEALRTNGRFRGSQ